MPKIISWQRQVHTSLRWGTKICAQLERVWTRRDRWTTLKLALFINPKNSNWRGGWPFQGRELDPLCPEVPLPVGTGVEGEGALLRGRVRRADSDGHALQGVGVGIFHQQHVPPRLGHGQGQLHLHLQHTGRTEGLCAGCYKAASRAARGDNAANLIKSLQTFTGFGCPEQAHSCRGDGCKAFLV